MQIVFRTTRVSYFKIIMLAAVVAAVLLAAGCQIVPLTGSSASQKGDDPGPNSLALPLNTDCLQGSWQVNNLARTMGDSIQSSGSPFEVESIGGGVIYTFLSDGKLEIKFDELKVRLRGDIDGELILAENRLEGSAEAQYEVDSLQQEMELSHFGGTGIFYQLELNDQVLAEGDFPSWQAFTSSLGGGTSGPDEHDLPTLEVDRSRVAVRCKGNTLAIQSLDPLPGPRMELERLQEK